MKLANQVRKRYIPFIRIMGPSARYIKPLKSFKLLCPKASAFRNESGHLSPRARPIAYTLRLEAEQLQVSTAGT
jgi:hypothetical protein